MARWVPVGENAREEMEVGKGAGGVEAEAEAEGGGGGGCPPAWWDSVDTRFFCRWSQMHTVASPAPVAKVPNPGWKDRAFTGKARSSPLGNFCRWHCGWSEEKKGGGGEGGVVCKVGVGV
jgi:hypothetical protein